MSLTLFFKISIFHSISVSTSNFSRLQFLAFTLQLPMFASQTINFFHLLQCSISKIYFLISNFEFPAYYFTNSNFHYTNLNFIV